MFALGRMGCGFGHLGSGGGSIVGPAAPGILLSNASVGDTATVGTTVGTFSTYNTTGTYTWSLTSNPGSLFILSGANLNTNAAMTVGTKPITVQASGACLRPLHSVQHRCDGRRAIEYCAAVDYGSPQVNQILTAVNGTWTGSPTIIFSYQWLREGVPIPGETGGTHTLVAADYGQRISVTVTGTNGVGASSATSAQTTFIAGTVPVNSVPPVIAGTTVVPNVPHRRRWDVGGRTPAPASYQWKVEGQLELIRPLRWCRAI
jgi:hypothetical protein